MVATKTAAAKTKAAAKQTVKQTAKTTAETAETVVDDVTKAAVGMFAANGIEVPEAFRSMTENGIAQARESYSQFKEKAEEATDLIEETFETARDGLVDLQHKSLDAAKQNTDAAFDYAKQMMGMTSIADAVQLQAKFAREQFESFVDYAKDFQTSATQVAEETARPAKKAYSQAVSAK
ncbi:MAG TPA: phasin [Afifellaceae bacterium]|nr:phasin [Afifellaceae bacterium]